MKSCAFHPCSEVTKCPLVGGCVPRRFGDAPRSVDPKRPGSKAHNGTKPGRATKKAPKIA